VFYTSSIIIVLGFYSKGTTRKRNIGWLNRVWFADPMIRGLGVHDLEVKNSALLGKCLYKLFTEDGVWQTLLKRKYIGTKALS
jgi:hypothetical protein